MHYRFFTGAGRTWPWAAIPLAVVFALASAAAVWANHSVGSPRHFYDNNNDTVADAVDANQNFQKLGAGWDTPKTQRYQEALNTWRLNTDYNPMFVSAAVNGLYVSGEPTNCGLTWAEIPSALGVTCRNERHQLVPDYWDIAQSWVYLNTGSGTWHIGTGTTPAGQWDMRGLMTHELGHTLRLMDLYNADCPPGPTMCGQIGTSADSLALRTLTSDDINSANSVYLP